MAKVSLTGIKEKIDGIFPLRTFCLSLTLLLLFFFGAIGVYKFFIAEPVEAPHLTGKTIAVAEVQKAIIDEPIKSVVTEEPPAIPTTPDTHDPVAEPTHETAPETHPETHPEPTHEDQHVTPAKPEPIPEPPKVTIPDMVEELTEKTSFGLLPVAGDTPKQKPFEVYKAPFSLNAETKGVISLVMVDYGLSDKISDTAVDQLPQTTSFVASPYVKDISAKISKAHEKGIEIWLGLPMQGQINSRKSNIGQNSILSGLSANENSTRLKENLGVATGYAGVAIVVEPAFQQNSQDLQGIINAISLRGLGVAQLTPHDSKISAAAFQTGASYVGGDLWADDILTKEAISQNLKEAEKMALEKGLAVVSFNPSLIAISTISDWQKTLSSKNIQLAPLTYAVKVYGPRPETKSEQPKESSHGSH